MLRVTSSIEQYSRHPLATSILEAARAEHIAPVEVTEINEKPGHGLHGTIGGDIIEITSRKQIASSLIAAQLPPVAPGMECIVLRNGQYLATLRF